MKCPNCGAEIPHGEVVCPFCGHEVQLVPDYHTVDSMLQEKKKREKEEAKKRQEGKTVQKKGTSHFIGRCIAVIVLTFALAGALVYCIHERASNDFAVLKSEALSYQRAGRYEEAEAVSSELIRRKPTASDLVLIHAQILMEEGKKEAALAALTSLVNENPDDEDALKALVDFYIDSGDKEKVTDVLARTDNEELKEMYQDYLPLTPVFSIMSGTYPAGTKLSISAADGVIYYTTDGSSPDKNSKVYRNTPIALNTGKNVIKAMCVNAKGIAGDVITGVFTVLSDTPDAPEISPESGSYEAGSQKIRVTVPEGETVYYTFDGTPSSGSDVYDGPVTMPEGTHIFSAILITRDGKTSKVASRTYNVS